MPNPGRAIPRVRTGDGTAHWYRPLAVLTDTCGIGVPLAAALDADGQDVPVVGGLVGAGVWAAIRAMRRRYAAQRLGESWRALRQGLLTEAGIDTAVRRQLSVRFRLGEFDPQDDPHEGTEDLDNPAHRALAQEAAEQAVVLLKNDGLLPLVNDTRIAVVGLLADECKLDWYSGTLLHRSTPLEGLYERFGAERVEFAEGVDRVRLRTGDGTFLHVPSVEGAAEEVRGAEGALDPALLAGRTDLPPLTTDATGTELALIDWGGGVLTLRAPDGRYLSVADDGHVRTSADQPGGCVVQETFRLEPHGNGHLLRHIGTGRHVSVAADGVKVAEEEDGGDVFEPVVSERGEDAVARAAARADVVLVVAGNDPHINGRETEDRTTLRLPDHQERLLRAARAANPNTALVLVSGTRTRSTRRP